MYLFQCLEIHLQCIYDQSNLAVYLCTFSGNIKSRVQRVKRISGTCNKAWRSLIISCWSLEAALTHISLLIIREHISSSKVNEYMQSKSTSAVIVHTYSVTSVFFSVSQPLENMNKFELCWRTHEMLLNSVVLHVLTDRIHMNNKSLNTTDNVALIGYN